ncbi:MAG: hypothetical protein HOV80_02205 [Polyangiaceae bacterium]|nr:hypothetical protein [Polyangiaceae bacterium]
MPHGGATLESLERAVIGGATSIAPITTAAAQHEAEGRDAGSDDQLEPVAIGAA